MGLAQAAFSLLGIKELIRVLFRIMNYELYYGKSHDIWMEIN